VIGEDGVPVTVGRPTRTVRADVRRRVVARDRGCRFTICDRPPAWCEVHHLVWRSRGGRHLMTNLALFCREHHDLFHEGRWRVHRRPDGELEFEPP
jgi:5-methylcytosine-specific restriction protein A